MSIKPTLLSFGGVTEPIRAKPEPSQSEPSQTKPSRAEQCWADTGHKRPETARHCSRSTLQSDFFDQRKFGQKSCFLHYCPHKTQVGRGPA